MKLYIEQSAFSWKNNFVVYDDVGKEKYNVENELSSMLTKLKLLDLCGQEVAFIDETVFTIFTKFFVSIGKEKVAQINKELSVGVATCSLKKPSYYELEGNFKSREFNIKDKRKNKIMATSKKVNNKFGDMYEIDIKKVDGEVYFLSVFIAIYSCLIR